MKDTLLELEAWTLNTVYDKVINCRAIKPTHKLESISWQDFMLDKRFWLTSKKSVIGQNFYDYIDIEWSRYYYWKDEVSGRLKLFNDNYELISDHPFREDNPVRLTKWRWGGWQLIQDATESTNNLTPANAVKDPQVFDIEATYTQWDWVTSWGTPYMCIKDTQWVSPPNSTYWTLAVSAATNSILNPYYDGWLIKLNVPWHWWTETRSRYITITTGILKWITNKILYASWDDIYISGTNVYWSLPDNDDKYFIFSDARETIIIWTDDWVTVISLTDDKDNLEYYYNLVITYSSYNFIALDINWIKILLSWSDDSANKTILETELWIWYLVEIENWLLFIAKTDWSIITFTELDSVTRVDINFLISHNSTYFKMPSLWLDFWWTEYHLGSWETNSSNDFLYYYPSWSTYNEFAKRDFYNKILANLPAWYSWIRKSWSYVTLLYTNWAWKQFKEIALNEELFLRKDDLTENAVTKYNTYWIRMRVKDDTSVSWTIDDIIITYDWIQYTYNFNATYVWTQIKTAIANLVNTIPNIERIEFVLDNSNWDYYIWSLHADDWKDKTASITFTWTDASTAIAWATFTLEDYNISDWNAIYWENLRWAIPADVNIHSESISYLNVNQTNAYSYEALTWEIIDGKQELNILDTVTFNGATFVLTDNQIFFSRITFDDNTHFYPLDQFPYRGWEKLIPFWQSLIVIWESNKIITKTTTTLFGTSWVTSYVMKDLEFNWNLFSKYSFKYTEWILYFLQEDRRLMTIQIAENDATSYRVSSNEISKAYRYLFENVQWECFVEQEWKFLNFIFVNWVTSENIQFDLSLNDWIINQYNKPIYRIWEDVLTWVTDVAEIWYIANEEWFTDFWENYSQEINFSIWNLIKFTKVNILRTIFGLTKEDRLDVTLTIEREEAAWVMHTTTHNLKDYQFDVSLDPAPDWDELLWYEEQIPYNWNLASLQTWLKLCWRFNRFKYKSETRFIMWPNYLLSDQSKPFVNDILTSN